MYIDGNGYFIDYGHCNVASDVTLYADWIQKFSVTWADWDGTVLETQQIFPGNMPAYTGPTPTRSPDVYNHYTFTGWSPTIQIVEANVIYTAQYSGETHNWGIITYEWPDDHESCTASATCQTCTYHLVDQGTIEKTDYRAAHCEVNERWKHTAEFTYFAADSCDTWHYGQDALGHLMGEWTRSDEPCCETEGEDTRNCQRDGCTHSETRVVAPTGHDWSEWVETTAPTCTTKGEDTRSCQNTCDDGCCQRTETREVAALGHLMGDWYTAVEPWCETSGYDERDCQRQGCSHYETSYLEPLGHIWPNSWERLRDPCCNTEGEDVRECLRDSRHHQYKDVPALGDRYGEWKTTADPCCEIEGKKIRYCQNGVCTASCGCCEYTETASIPALGHNWSEWKQMVKPWCSTEGVESRYCLNDCTHGCCGLETRPIPALGHIWPSDWTTEREPCCNTAGVAVKRCQRDASHKQTQGIPALGCNWGSWRISLAPNCTENGRHIRYCQNGCDLEECGCCYVAQWEDIPALGHLVRWTKYKGVDCRDPGYRESYCARSGCPGFTSSIETPGDQGPHRWIYEYTNTSNGLHHNKCYYCDEECDTTDFVHWQ